MLPIIPGFLVYLAGQTTSGEPSNRREIFYNSVFFVIGFSLVFALLGVLLNGLLVHVALNLQIWLSRIGGAVVIFFGLYLMGFIKINALEYDHKIAPSLKFKSRYATSLLFGLAFAAGWTPCVGPVLAGILGLAAAVPGIAFSLLLVYALGLGLPFLLVGAFAGQISTQLAKYTNVSRRLTPIFGLLLIVLGILVFTQSLTLIANVGWLNNILLR